MLKLRIKQHAFILIWVAAVFLLFLSLLIFYFSSGSRHAFFNFINYTLGIKHPGYHSLEYSLLLVFVYILLSVVLMLMDKNHGFYKYLEKLFYLKTGFLIFLSLILFIKSQFVVYIDQFNYSVN